MLKTKEELPAKIEVGDQVLVPDLPERKQKNSASSECVLLFAKIICMES